MSYLCRTSLEAEAKALREGPERGVTNLISRLNGGATRGFLVLFRYTRTNLARDEPAADL
jgi:hypothetical protein